MCIDIVKVCFEFANVQKYLTEISAGNTIVVGYYRFMILLLQNIFYHANLKKNKKKTAGNSMLYLN